MKTDDRKWLFVALLLGALERSVHLFFFSKTPFFTGYFLDELYHHRWAKAIASGNFLPDGVFFRAPLYPYFLGVIYFIFGDGPWTPRIIQMLLGLGSTVAVWLIAKEVIREKLGVAVAAMLWAVCPILIYYEARLLLDAPFSSAFPWLIWFAIRSRQKRGFIWFTGILLGFMSITRPTAIVIFPVLAIFLAWGSSRPILLVLKFALATAIPIFPVTISNTLNGDFVLISSQGGINFYIGNNPKSDGVSAIVPEFGHNWQYRQCKSLAERSLGRELSPAQVSSFFMRKGISFWFNHPIPALKLVLKKIWLLLGATEIGNNGNIYFLFDGSPLKWSLWIGWSFVLVLAILSFRYSSFWYQAFFAGLAITYMASVVLFFVCSRFRLPVIAILIVPAGAGFSALVELVRVKRFAPVLASTILYALLWLDPWKMRRPDDALSRFALGNIHFRQGRYSDALSEYRRALELAPGARSVSLNIGALFFKIGELDSARKYFENEASNPDGEKSRAMANLSFLAKIMGDTASALVLSQMALEYSDSTDAAVWFNRIKVLLWSGDYRNAAKEAELSIARTKDPGLINLAGTVFLALGDTMLADELFEVAGNRRTGPLIEWYDLGTLSSELVGLGASGERVRAMALYNRGQIAFARGNWQRAETLFIQSILADTSFVLSYSAIGTMALARKNFLRADTFLGKALSIGDSSLQTLFNFAGTRFKLGDTTTSLRLLEIISRRNPDFAATGDKSSESPKESQ